MDGKRFVGEQIRRKADMEQRLVGEGGEGDKKKEIDWTFCGRLQ